MSELRAQLLAAAAAGPDPLEAPTRIARFCDAAGAALPERLLGEGQRLLSALSAQSPYLTAPLVREPQLLDALAADPFLRREKDAATMAAELAEVLASEELARGLRRYRNREYLRLGARELGWGVATEVARELAHLAEVCLQAAHDRLLAELVERYGPPLTDEGRRCRFVVFGMGKLGGEELNFSSDIDLLYLYETDQGAAGELSLHQFFVRLCERLTKVVGESTDEGFVFRVDLRLRPEGSRGPLCNSLGAAERYYETFGRPWERQAWVKARPVAGDLDLGGAALDLLAPFVWPRTTGGGVIRAVHELMARMRQERATEHDVKLGPGGIREVEFFTQALQLVHGGRNPALRVRSTLLALERLRTSGIISEREHQTLSDAYAFLRRVEHRLQLADGRQTHALPHSEEGEALLARRLGFPDRAAFAATLAETRKSVSEIFATLGAPESAPPPEVLRLLDPAASRADLVTALTALEFRNPEASADEMTLLRERPQSPFAPAAPADIAAKLLEEVVASPDPDLAMRRLVDLLGRPSAELWRLVAAHRPLLRLLITLFGTSEFLGKTLVAHPELIEPLLSSAQAQRVRRREDFDERILRAQEGTAADDEEARLNALRRVKHEELLRIGLFDIGGELTAKEVATQLSELADAMLEAALAVVAPATFRRFGVPTASLAVMGLGKLGGKELGYASDLDVIFVYSDEGQATGGKQATNFEVMSRLAQRLIHALSVFLDEGRLYEIDTRLRPSGQKGALVSSRAGFRAYHAKEAALWERQALIKIRTVAGDVALGREIEQLAEGYVYDGGELHPTSEAELAAAIGRLRARMERELAQETPHKFNIKTGRGGLVDVEFLVQLLQLVHGPRLPAVRQRATFDGLWALREAGILPLAEARTLTEAYAFLRRLENRLRIVHDRSIQEITDRPDELTKLARRLGYVGAGVGARLLSDYRAHTERVRTIYARYLPTEGTSIA